VPEPEASINQRINIIWSSLAHSANSDWLTESEIIEKDFPVSTQQDVRRELVSSTKEW